MRFIPLLAAALLFAAPAFSKASYPGRLDAACLAQGRTPPNPAALERATGVPYADCALCHDIDPARGRYPTGANDNADGAAYKRGDLDPFCVVAAVNGPPVLAPIGSVAVAVGQPVALLLQASDPDGDALGFSANGLPAGALFLDAGNGMASFDWTPAQPGNTAITFSVSDGQASDSERVVITAGAVNATPVLEAIGDQTVAVGSTLALTLRASDPEGGALRFDALGLPAGATLRDFGDGSAELAFAPVAAGAASVTVTVTDAGAPPESTSETFALVAEDPATGPGPALEAAGWDPWEAALFARGGGAAPGSEVTIVDAPSGAALGVAHAGPTGRFELAARTFLAPCVLRARGADGALGSPIGVIGAPPGCGDELLTHAKARWRCKDGLLGVRGSRAPVESAVTVLDAASGAEVMQTQSDRRGRFRLAARRAQGPANVRIRLASGAGEWLLGPLAVSGAGVSCGDRDEDDDD